MKRKKQRKWHIEESQKLSSTELKEAGILKDNNSQQGALGDSLLYRINTGTEFGEFEVAYRAEGEEQRYVIKLEMHRLHMSGQKKRIGGSRWWLVCPDCKGIARFLYIPPEAKRFACWRCHDLMYRQCSYKTPQKIKTILSKVNSVDEIFAFQEDDETLLRAVEIFMERRAKK